MIPWAFDLFRLPDENSLMTNDPQSRFELMRQLAEIRKQLSHFHIRDAADYAEALVAEALEGERLANKVNQGHDVLTKQFGRVEVKCRQLPSDGRIEERVEISISKKDGFEHLAIVVFLPNFSIKGAVIVPYSSVWNYITIHKYKRLSYKQACLLDGALDITSRVLSAAKK